jgi:hypothetical protein
MSMSEWKVRGSNPFCHGCGRVFAPEAAFYSALYFVAPDLERRDFCPLCWKTIPAGNTLAYWTLRAPDDATDVQDVGPLDMNRMKRLIKVDFQKPTAPPGLAGLLCLLMARRRLARIESVRENVLRVRFKGDEESCEVPSPRMDPVLLESAQNALWDLLDQLAGNHDRGPSPTAAPSS